MMHNKFLCVAVLCFVFTMSNTYSQGVVLHENQSGEYTTAGQMAEMGTFHFNIPDPKKGIQIFTIEQMDELRIQIESSRSQADRVYWNYNEYITIVIYSKNEITDPHFVPTTELYQN